MNIYNLISDLDKKISAEVEIDDKNNIQEKYNFNQHRHNFARWTSAIAVQINFTIFNQKLQITNKKK